MDDVKIYSRVLSDEEVTALYDENGSGQTISVWKVGENAVYMDDANVAIGTSNVPAGFRLAVDGDIIAKRIKVSLDGTLWSDFVFNKDYDLMSLQELEYYIQKNNHLPSVPSKKIVKEQGIDMVEMDARLLQKIEELTLYVIELNKEIENLKAKNFELEKMIGNVSVQ